MESDDGQEVNGVLYFVDLVTRYVFLTPVVDLFDVLELFLMENRPIVSAQGGDRFVVRPKYFRVI